MHEQTTTVATATPKPKLALKDWLTSEELAQQVQQCLPAHLTKDRFMRILFTQVQKQPKLMLCTQNSLFACMIQLGQHGIEPDGRRAALIPRRVKFKPAKGDLPAMAEHYECSCIIMYQGFAELAYNSGKISNLHAALVCENDVFEEDMGRVIKHVIDRRTDRGEPYAAWAKVEFKDGSVKFEIMSKPEIYAIRDKSEGYRAAKAGYGDSPWTDKQAEGEMWKKTVFLRLKKWIPLSAELRDIIASEPDDIIELSAAPKGGQPLRLASLPDQDSIDAAAPEAAKDGQGVAP